MVGEEQAKIAAASLFCARSVLNVTPVWPLNLQRLLGLNESEFGHCNQLLLSTYVMEDSRQEEMSSTPPRKKTKKMIPETPVTDEGYVSRTSFVVEEESSPSPNPFFPEKNF